MKLNFKTLFFFSLILNSLIVFGFVSSKLTEEKPSHSKYPYLSQRVFVENPKDFLTNFMPLRNALQVYITANGVDKISVYFEYLPSGTSVGVNDRKVFQIASLIKVPVVLAVYKQIEEGKLFEDQLLIVTEGNIDKRFGDLWKKGAGTKVTVKEAVDLALKESDNTAASLLLDTVGDEALTNVFTNLEIDYLKEKRLTLISAKGYSSVFRTLYLSSYLKFENSQKILDILTQTKFKSQLEAGVSSGTMVAHKIGTYTDNSGSGVYSDCGNVYLANRPYFLCIMIQGDETYATQHMAEISTMVFKFVESVEGRERE